ncbi:alcohol dehydrogenase [Schleiferilactobacillus shenzhenensis LY-73]|uniref:Alcohol dehydrogenase n=2 Tax=Schleiferilactobacillus shenzhenensis TaxID=1231337 RepID=U4TLG0_9LACO|nr:alcohol dehydrogenase [Schleiferilactobacillus shenzhenensis LY-73]
MGPKTMTATQIGHYGQHDVDRVLLPIPQPAPGEVLVKIQAASINPIDLKTRDGKMRPLLHYRLPLTLGSDLAGDVAAVGEGVTDFHVGDPVYGRVMKDHIGTFAEYITIAAAALAPMPQTVTYAAAAALPLVSLTAYQALHDILRVGPGQKVLIQAGAGGIGTVAIQLAKTLGAYVATTTSAAHRPLVQQLGADQVIDYHQDRFDVVLHDYDAVLDTLGGDNLRRGFTILKPGGRIVSVAGLPNRRFAQATGRPLWQRTLFTLTGWPLSRLERQYHVRYTFLFMQPSGRQLQTIGELVDSGQLHPVIDRVVSFTDIQRALDYSETGHARGKIVVTMA